LILEIKGYTVDVTSTVRIRSLLIAGLLVVLAGCDNGSSSPVAPDQSSVAYSQTDLTVGTGAEATTGKTVTVQYIGWLYSETAADHKGRQFDSGQLPPFVVGAGSLIKGFEMAVTGMKVGGVRRAIIPPSLAYGTTGNAAAQIPPNAAVVFEIALGVVQ
jgi:FKBP-type peptidyl-prolyl cis-trans isomerase FkpA